MYDIEKIGLSCDVQDKYLAGALRFTVIDKHATNLIRKNEDKWHVTQSASQYLFFMYSCFFDVLFINRRRSMCGIYAVSGSSEAVSRVFFGLKDLEYRGYDSWGIAVGKRKKISTEKHTGKMDVTSSRLPASSYAIGHTRWATHGGVSVANAHPHTDCSHRIAVVHNGIVENYQELKKQLRLRHEFVSQTDTEVIAHLIEDELKQTDILRAVQQVFPMLKGLNALVVYDVQTNEMVAVRNGSPLVVGYASDALLVASDSISLSRHTRSIVYLPDNVYAHIQGKEVTYSDLKRHTVSLKAERLRDEVVPITRGDYAHFMEKEICEQPALISQAHMAYMPALVKMAATIKKKKHLVISGCGSAYFASLFASYLFSLRTTVPVQAMYANEIDMMENWLNSQAFTLFVSQSGETIDVIQAHKLARTKKSLTGAIVNVMGSTLSRSVDFVVPLCVGPEVAVASTKAWVLMITVMYMLASVISGEDPAKREYLLTQAARAGSAVLDSTFRSEYIQPLVNVLAHHKDVFILGKGLLYPVALEAALKLKEVTYIHAEGVAAGELKHGMIALIKKGTPCIVLVPDDATKQDVLSSAMEVRARGGYIIGISSVSYEVFDLHIPIQACGHLSAIPMIMVIQLVAYKLALALRNDPDKPRNLAKSVTVK